MTMAPSDAHHDHDSDHSHGAGAALSDRARDILRRGIDELLQMTEAMTFQPVASEKFPLPLTSVAHAQLPGLDALRVEIEARKDSDPIRILDEVLALLELYECNQPDIAEHILQDMPFVATCFNSKRRNGWIAVVGDGDRAALESAVNDRWLFEFFSGPARPTGLYVLLSMLARYAFVYGPVAPGDSHTLSHFVEDLAPGVIVCHGALSDLEWTLALAAMKMGVPAVVPADYPFGLGRTLQADTPEQIAETVVGLPNIRRLLQVPDIPQLPPYCNGQFAGQEITPAVTWGGTSESFFIVRKGSVSKPGFAVTAKPTGPIGIVVTADAEPMDAVDCDYIEQAVLPTLAMMDGVAVDAGDDGLTIHMGEGIQLDPKRIGEALLAAVGNQFPKLHDRTRVEVIFDVATLGEIAPDVRAEKLARADQIARATEESAEQFIGCTGCSPFAPDHVCIITPERPTQCGRPMGLLKTNAQYAYDDMSGIHHSRLQKDVNSFIVIDKGECIDPVRGEWSGVNAHAQRMTDGRTQRVQLHCLDEVPHTGCGCFRLILFKTASPREGVGVMDRGFGGACADGRAWNDLYYELAGKQTPGVTGAGPGYLLSDKFLAAHGGWDSVVWVSPRVAEFMGDRLPDGVDVGREPEAG